MYLIPSAVKLHPPFAILSRNAPEVQKSLMCVDILLNSFVNL